MMNIGRSMDDYNFWADLLASYRASPDLVKVLWVLVPPAFLLGLVAVLRLTRRRARQETVYPLDAIGGSEEGFVPLRRYETAALPQLGFDDVRTGEPSPRSPSR